jgi:riboflavin synthase
VTAVHDGAFLADLSTETLSRTLFGELEAGSWVNLERAMLPTTRMGGHLVTGHVDGIGRLVARGDASRSVIMEFEVPDPLSRYLAEKGSVCIDGVSLTVNAVDGCRFSVNLVPHTLDVTSLGTLAVGDRVHLEADLVARYLDRLLDARGIGRQGVE